MPKFKITVVETSVIDAVSLKDAEYFANLITRRLPNITCSITPYTPFDDYMAKERGDAQLNEMRERLINYDGPKAFVKAQLDEWAPRTEDEAFGAYRCGRCYSVVRQSAILSHEPNWRCQVCWTLTDDTMRAAGLGIPP